MSLRRPLRLGLSVAAGFVLFLMLTTLTHAAAPPVYYTESQEDLRVKVLGGAMVIQRTFANGQWYPNYNWAPLRLTFDTFDSAVKAIARGKATYAKTAPGVFTYQKRNTIRQTTTGFRWTNREGDWIEFDSNGDIQRYGNRNGITVSFQYETVASGKRISGVFDHFDRQMLWYDYTSTLLTAIRDYTGRQVQYQYTGTLITSVIDVNGHIWHYGYTGEVPTTFTDPENRTITRTWGSNGELASLRYDDGVGIDYGYEYDSSKGIHYTQEKTTGGRITETWRDANGEILRRDVNGTTIQTRSIDTAARTRTETDPRGLKTIREYDPWDNLTKITYPDGTTVTTTYDPIFSNPMQKMDEQGVLTTYEYDTHGNLTKMTEAVGYPEERVTEYTYDNFGRRLSETRRGGTVVLPENAGSVDVEDATTAFEYDDYGNVTATVDPEGFRTEFSSHDALGNVRTRRDERQNIWTRTYDNRGILTSDRNPLGHTNRIEYNRAGQRIKSIDAANHSTTYTYDAQSRLTKTTDALGNSSAITYDAAGQVAEETDFAGQVTRRITYDRDGRVLTQQDGVGNTVEFVYGAPNSGSGDLPIAIRYPTFIQTTQYDIRNRPTAVTTTPKPEFNINATSALTTRYEYDAVGNRITMTDSASTVTRYSFDAHRRITAVTDAADGVTRFAFDPRDNLLAVLDANGNQHRMDVDRLGRKTKETRPGGEAWQWSYDAVGNLATQTDAKGQITRHSYDSANRLTQTQIGTKTITYGYNAVGQLTNYNDGSTSASITLDELHRKTAETVNFGAFSHTYRYRYTANGTKSALVYPDGTEVTYSFDVNQKLTQIQLPQGVISTTYNNAYTQMFTLYPGGTTSTTQLDALLQVTSLDVKDPTQQTLLAYQYSYDAAGNITEQATELGTHRFQYDELYRLTQATYGHGLASDAYTYDKVHNRITDQVQAGTWSYNSNNQLLTQGNLATWRYDTNGQAIEKKPAAGATRSFVYNPENRLSEVKDDNQTLAQYSYDTFGRRVKKVVTNLATVTSTTTYYLYVDEGLLAEIDSTGRITMQYGWQPDALSGTNPIYRLDKDLTTNTNSLVVYHNDHLGTPQKLTNSQGQILWRQRQKAFGEITVDNTPTITNNLRFPGQYFDQETQTHYNFFRDYDPKTGRYVQGDPVRFAGGMNFYAYALAAPTRFIDVMGLLPDCRDVPLSFETRRRRTGQRRNVKVSDEYSRIEGLRVEPGNNLQPGAEWPDRRNPNHPLRPCIAISVGKVIIVRQFYTLQTGEEEVVYFIPVQRYCHELRQNDCGEMVDIRFDYKAEKETQRQWEGFSDEIPGRRIRYEIPLGGPCLLLVP